MRSGHEDLARVGMGGIVGAESHQRRRARLAGDEMPRIERDGAIEGGEREISAVLRRMREPDHHLGIGVHTISIRYCRQRVDDDERPFFAQARLGYVASSGERGRSDLAHR